MHRDVNLAVQKSCETSHTFHSFESEAQFHELVIIDNLSSTASSDVIVQLSIEIFRFRLTSTEPKDHSSVCICSCHASATFPPSPSLLGLCIAVSSLRCCCNSFKFFHVINLSYFSSLLFESHTFAVFFSSAFLLSAKFSGRRLTLQSPRIFL